MQASALASYTRMVWAPPLSLAATQGIDLFFLFLGLLRCFSSPGSPPLAMCSPVNTRAFPRVGSPIRVPPDLRPLAAPRGVSPLAAPFLGSWCLGIHRTPFPLLTTYGFVQFSRSPRGLPPSKMNSEASLLRKEVIQPHLPIRLPCYDFTPITCPTFDGSLLPGWVTGFGCRRLSWCDGRCVQGPGTYSPRHADPRLLAIPTSCRRVAACNPNLDRLFGIRSRSLLRIPLYRPL